MRPTVAFFQDTAIAIAVLEMTEPVLLRYVGHDKGNDGYIRETEYQANLRKYRQQHTWTTTRDLPCGRLRIVAFSAEGVKWSRSWQEKGPITIDGSLHRIAREIRGWIEAQPMYVVASAPLAGDGHVNCSPKGMAGTFAVLDGHRVAYLDYFGSGIETLAHLRENGRIVIMLCALDGPPKVVRLHGRGRAVRPEDAEFGELRGRFAKSRDRGVRRAREGGRPGAGGRLSFADRRASGRAGVELAISCALRVPAGGGRAPRCPA